MLDLVDMAQRCDNTGAAALREAIEVLHRATAIYTAEPVVDQLLSRVDWPAGGRVLVDPSCGDGAFLVAALRRALARRQFDDEALCGLLSGWEIHPDACAFARARVTATLMAAGRSQAQANSVALRIVQHGDFLTDGPAGPRYDVIAGNPPYLRWANIPTALREHYVHHVPPYALQDMLYGFLERCVRVLRPHGDIVFVTSDRWLFNAGAAKLRQAIGQLVRLSHLERLDARSAYYRPKSRSAGTPPRVHPVAVHLRQGEGQAITQAALYPGVASTSYDGCERLGDVAIVRLAPWLGSPGIFVIDHATATAARIPAPYLVPAIDTDDIVGDSLLPPRRFAIRTWPDVQPCPEIMSHLALNLHRMAARGRQGTAWLPPELFHRFDLDAPSLLVPRIVRAPRAVLVPPGYLPINHNLSIVSADARTLDRVRWALARPLAQQWIKERAAPLENGFVSLTTRLLRQLPLEPCTATATMDDEAPAFGTC